VTSGPSAGDDHLAAPAHETCLAIGGLTFRIASADPLLATSGEYDALRAFATAPAAGDVVVRARWSDRPLNPAGDLIFDSGGLWQLRRRGATFEFAFHSSATGPTPYKIATFNSAFTDGDVQLRRAHFATGTPVYPLQYPLDELVMIHLLAQGRGIELHGCALVDRAARAWVFPGQSGAGKSTLARLWADRPDVTLLSDERIIVRTDDGRLRVYGTPWHGDAMLASPITGDLGGIFFLAHYPTHAIVPVSGTAAAARLLACAFLPFHDPAGVANTAAAAERIAAAVPCHELRFAPDRSVVDVLLAHFG
jgi:hypothetical protein